MEKTETSVAYVEVTFSSRLCTVPQSLGLYFSTLFFCLFAVHQLRCNNDNKQSFYSICCFFWQSMKVAVIKFWYLQNKNNFKKRYSLCPKVPSFSDEAYFHVDIQAVTWRGCSVFLVAVPFCVWGSIFWLGRVIFTLLSSSAFKIHTCYIY